MNVLEGCSRTLKIINYNLGSNGFSGNASRSSSLLERKRLAARVRIKGACSPTRSFAHPTNLQMSVRDVYDIAELGARLTRARTRSREQEEILSEDLARRLEAEERRLVGRALRSRGPAPRRELPGRRPRRARGALAEPVVEEGEEEGDVEPPPPPPAPMAGLAQQMFGPIGGDEPFQPPPPPLEGEEEEPFQAPPPPPPPDLELELPPGPPGRRLAPAMGVVAEEPPPIGPAPPGPDLDLPYGPAAPPPPPPPPPPQPGQGGPAPYTAQQWLDDCRWLPIGDTDGTQVNAPFVRRADIVGGDQLVSELRAGWVEGETVASYPLRTNRFVLGSFDPATQIPASFRSLVSQDGEPTQLLALRAGHEVEGAAAREYVRNFIDPDALAGQQGVSVWSNIYRVVDAERVQAAALAFPQLNLTAGSYFERLTGAVATFIRGTTNRQRIANNLQQLDAKWTVHLNITMLRQPDLAVQLGGPDRIVGTRIADPIRVAPGMAPAQITANVQLSLAGLLDRLTPADAPSGFIFAGPNWVQLVQLPFNTAQGLALPQAGAPIEVPGLNALRHVMDDLGNTFLPGSAGYRPPLPRPWGDLKPRSSPFTNPAGRGEDDHCCFWYCLWIATHEVARTGDWSTLAAALEVDCPPPLAHNVQRNIPVYLQDSLLTELEDWSVQQAQHPTREGDACAIPVPAGGWAIDVVALLEGGLVDEKRPFLGAGGIVRRSPRHKEHYMAVRKHGEEQAGPAPVTITLAFMPIYQALGVMEQDKPALQLVGAHWLYVKSTQIYYNLLRHGTSTHGAAGRPLAGQTWLCAECGHVTRSEAANLTHQQVCMPGRLIWRMPEADRKTGLPPAVKTKKKRPLQPVMGFFDFESYTEWMVDPHDAQGRFMPMRDADGPETQVPPPVPPSS